MEKRIRTKKAVSKASTVVPGLYRRGATYWLKHYVDGKAHRVSLGTDDLSLAVQKAEITRRTPLLDPSGR